MLISCRKLHTTDTPLLLLAPYIPPILLHNHSAVAASTALKQLAQPSKHLRKRCGHLRLVALGTQSLPPCHARAVAAIRLLVPVAVARPPDLPLARVRPQLVF
eukprot:2879142-Pleurochrysis_carterae.AAC.2